MSPKDKRDAAKRKKHYRYGRLMTRGDRASVYLMLIPLVVPFILFCIYPILYLINLSFYSYDGISTKEWVGLYNYVRLFRESSWWNVLKNTLQLGILVPLVQVPLALVLASVLNTRLRGTAFFRTFLFLPNITSTAIMGVIFAYMFAAHNGVVNNLLSALNIVNEPVGWLSQEVTAKLVIVIFSAWAGTGFYMVLFLAGLQKIPQDVYESAALDGANSVQAFFHITIPLLGPMFKIVIMLSILNAVQLFDTVKVLTGGGPGSKTEVMTMYIYKYFFEPTGGTMQQGYASAAAIMGLLVMGLIGIAYFVVSYGTDMLKSNRKKAGRTRT